MSYIQLSQPEAEERAAALSSQSLVLSPPPDPRDSEILSRLQNILFTGPQKAAVPAGKYRAASIAKLAGTAEPYISMYLNWGPGKTVNCQEVETRLKAWFSALESGEETGLELSTETAQAPRFFPTAFTAGAAAFFATCHRAGCIGALTADAGSGKHAAKVLYAAQKPLTIIIECAQFLGTAGALISTLCTRLGLRARVSDGSTKMERLIAALLKRERLIILDNSQRLSLGALRFLFDLWDAAADAGKKLSIVFMGNEEIIGKLQANPQHSSRLCRTMDGNKFWRFSGRQKVAPEVTLAEACAGLVDAHLSASLTAPEKRKIAAACTRLAAVENGGRLRLVTNVLKGTQSLLDGSFADAWEATRQAYADQWVPEGKRIAI